MVNTLGIHIKEGIKQTKRTKQTINALEERINKVHGTAYTYHNFIYETSKVKSYITCPIHGDFLMSMDKHIFRKQGCPKCGKLKTIAAHKYTTKDFIKKANKVHNNKYTYNNCKYTKSNSSVIITCPIHGDFTQIATTHIQGHGCKKCANIKTKESILKTTEDFLTKAKQIHGDTYKYDLVNYAGATTKVTITCRKHGNFEQTPNNHLSNKQGCPYCAVKGFNPLKPSIVYFVKIISIKTNIEVFKIGVTNNNVKKRFRNDKNIKVIYIDSIYCEKGYDALKIESILLTRFKQDKYKGDNFMLSGNTELITKDITSIFKKIKEDYNNGFFPVNNERET